MSDMAVKYAMMKRAKKMNHGGDCYADGGNVKDEDVHKDPMAVEKSIKKAFKGPFAHGGEVDQEDIDMAEMEDMDDDMIEAIMRKRYSKGGKVANDTPPMVDSEKADYDDLALRDDLEFDYTGENSGDELGNEKLDEDDRDLVAAIMKSRKKKDKLPHPM